VGQGGLKAFHYDVIHKKTALPKQKNFFRVQTRRLVATFVASTRSITSTGAEMFPRKAMCI